MRNKTYKKMKRAHPSVSIIHSIHFQVKMLNCVENHAKCVFIKGTERDDHTRIHQILKYRHNLNTKYKIAAIPK